MKINRLFLNLVVELDSEPQTGAMRSTSVLAHNYANTRGGRIADDPTHPDPRHDVPEHGPNMYRVNVPGLQGLGV